MMSKSLMKGLLIVTTGLMVGCGAAPTTQGPADQALDTNVPAAVVTQDLGQAVPEATDGKASYTLQQFGGYGRYYRCRRLCRWVSPYRYSWCLRRCLYGYWGGSWGPWGRF